MTSRFERLFWLKENLYAEESPIIIAAGALLKDNASERIVVRLKFQSVSQKRITAVKVSLSAFDVSQKELQGVSDYQYLDLKISNGETFGSQTAIVMPSEVTRSFAINKIIIVFDDDSVWESTSPFISLSTLQPLYQERNNSEFNSVLLQEEYCLETSWDSKYTPKEALGLWQCACGCWNSGTLCTHCRISKEAVFSALNLETE